ncbi:response regulator transcription factor [Anaerobacillus arseniciselenatis]|nr:response regulator transcription factor [Anaerobacillus arseniciselenatis]
MSNSVKVFIVDDHVVVRKGLEMFLEADEKIKVCGEAGNLNEAIELIGHKRPDVVLLDFKLPDGDGITGCLKIKNMYPHIKVIILTAFANENNLLEAKRAGAEAYLLKDVECEQLTSTIFSIYNDNGDLASPLMVNAKKQKNDFNLSNKETKILDMVSLGKVNKEIAERLNVSEKTVRNYICKIFKKINVTNRTEAASFWLRQKDGQL